MAIDAERLALEIERTASAILGRDVTQDRGRSSRPARRLAERAIHVAGEVARGYDVAADDDDLLDDLDERSLVFVRTNGAMSPRDAERLWSAVVRGVWHAMSLAAGVPLEVPAPHCADESRDRPE